MKTKQTVTIDTEILNRLDTTLEILSNKSQLEINVLKRAVLYNYLY